MKAKKEIYDQRINKALVKTHRFVYDYAKGDFDGLRNALRSLNLIGVVGEGDLESFWQT